MFWPRKTPPAPPPGEDWDGPDDLWPPEPPEPEPQVTVIRQWGLQLPDGSTAWGGWQGITFDNPLNRVRMIATLQKTALNVGFAEGEQVAQFLSHYSWQTRDATVSTVFSPVVTTFVLHDPGAVEVTDNGSAEEAHE